MKNSLIKIAFHYLEMSAMYMLLAMSNGSEKLETIQKVLEENEHKENSDN